MPAVAYELQSSRVIRFNGDRPGTALEFIVTGATEESEVLDAIKDDSPYRFNGFTRTGYDATPQGVDVWYATVEYGIPDPTDSPSLFPGEELSPEDQETDPSVTPPDQSETPVNPFGTFPEDGGPNDPSQPSDANTPLGPEWSFDTGPAQDTFRVAFMDATRGGLESRYVGRRFDADGDITEETPINFGGLINVREGDRGKLEVQGSEAPAGAIEIPMTRPVKSLTLKYIRLLAEMKGSVNSTPFLGWAAGELRFISAAGQYKPPTSSGEEGGFSVTWRFAALPNRVAPAIDPEVPATKLGLQIAKDLYLRPGETKEGWDLIDVLYKDTLDADLGKTLPTAMQYAIHRLHPRADFRFLGFSKYGY